jgi:hypothetical protein
MDHLATLDLLTSLIINAFFFRFRSHFHSKSLLFIINTIYLCRYSTKLILLTLNF